jgi:mannose-6-phosphate isomerase-like protein (cupin superfamily)
MEAVNLSEKFNLINEHWSPKLLGELNNQAVKIAKLKGEFIWHHHENEDEMFFVIEGSMTIKLKDKDIVLNKNEFFIIPKGVEHKPVAKNEVLVMMFEPMSTINTGNIESDITIKDIKKV